MNVLATVTQKGQFTLPKAIRDKYKITPYSRVKIEDRDGEVVVTPVRNILDLAGSVIAPKGKTALSARKAMEKNYERV